MKTIGLLTQDFAAYYDLVKYLKEHDTPFLSLAFDEPVPASVGVVITTPGEAGRVAFAELALYRGFAQPAVDLALETLAGRPQYTTVVVGVDPGERPGIAVYGDGRLLRTEQVHLPELVVDEVARTIEALSADHFVVRVGHGAGTLRDRIINELLRADRTSRASIEVVDETSTSPVALRGQPSSDVAAAKAIAMAQGHEVRQYREIRPSDGEMRDLQRKSRIASEGTVTISRDLAREVASGRLTLDEAIARQRGERGAAPS
ncbi:MAG TPA: hypothetical protein VGR28_07880 [Candidatus Thermoplasmatota archaeon]|nr:hypothetical protein [Candidatus Thermoplasmatota archaeon]